MEKISPLLNYELHETIDESIGYVIEGEDIIGYIYGTLINKKKSYKSTSCLRYNSTGGYTSMTKIISGNTI